MTTETRTKTTLTIDAGTLLAAFDTCLATMAKASDSRPVLQAVKVIATGGSAKIVSADGWALTIVDIEHERIGTLDVLIHGDSVKAIVGMLKRVDKCERETTQVELSDAEFSIPGVGMVPVVQVMGTFPDFEKLIPDTPETTTDKVAINANLILKMAQVASRYAGSGIVRMFPGESDKSPITMHWNIAEGVNVRYVCMPMYVQWDD